MTAAMILRTLVITGSTLSILACAWLMKKIGMPVQKRLLPRQLWHLALADVVTCAGNLLYEFSGEPMLTGSGRWLGCSIAAVIWCGAMASDMFELHVAVGFAAVFWRSRCLVQVLNFTLWLPWPVALVESVSLGILHLSDRDNDIAGDILADDIFTLSILIVAGFTFVFFAFAGFRSWWYPLRQARQATVKMWSFPLAFISTFGLMTYVILSGHDMQSRTFARIFASLNGLCNVSCYACQFSRSSPELLQSVVSANPVEDWTGLVLPLGFAVHVEHIAVVPVQCAALRESERGMAVLEKHNFHDPDSVSTLSSALSVANADAV